MADNEQELLSREEVVSKIPPDDGFTYYRAFGELIARAQVAKLKAMGYESPEEVKKGEEEVYENGKREGYSIGRADAETEGYVKWDREKVAELIMNRDYEAGECWCSWKAKSAGAEITRKYYRGTADQLKEILTGGE